MKKTIGVFAHVDAGKTTFSEQLLYHTKAIRTLGRVDHKDAFLDTHNIEKRRGITIFAEQAYFTYNQNEYYLIDTPGHVDFSAEMERAIQIIDYAVIIISGIDGLQSHTETVYELLQQAQKPVFFFINKMDAAHADLEKCLLEIQSLSESAVNFQEDNYLEKISEKDETLMTYFFEEQFDMAFDQRVVELIQKRTIMPVFYGSSLRDENIDLFLKHFDQLTKSSYGNGELKGYVYKIKYDPKGVRQTFIKLIQGKLKVRDTIGSEKITEIRKHQGLKYEVLNSVEAGDVFSVIGLLELKVGDTLGDTKSYLYQVVPSLKSKVIFDDSLNAKDIYKMFKILEDEDPSLNVKYEVLNKEITLGIMGTIQLEILVEVILDRFGYEVAFDQPTIIYKESIQDCVVGYGHFEPLKHYCEVHLKLEPNPGKGIEFINACSTDHLSYGNQNLVKHHVFEKAHRGILTGSDLTDLKITLLTGRAHNKHTSGGDFREATIRALRQGLEQADNILLEPIYEAVISVPMSFMGRILTDVQQRHGLCLEPKQIGEQVIITAHVPVATFVDYPTELASLTSGKGRIRLKVIHYKTCHNTDEVIEEINYDKITDGEYPSSSVFCTKGKGYTVKWDVAKDYMHCL